MNGVAAATCCATRKSESFGGLSGIAELTGERQNAGLGLKKSDYQITLDLPPQIVSAGRHAGAV